MANEKQLLKAKMSRLKDWNETIGFLRQDWVSFNKIRKQKKLNSITFSEFLLAGIYDGLCELIEVEKNH